jgi:hypothetical protein
MVLNSLTYELSVADFNVVNISLEMTKNYQTLNCCTAEGYNLLHYAILGGNIDLAIRLKSEGLSLITENVSLPDIMFMLSFAGFKRVTNQSSKTYNFVENLKADNIISLKDVCKKRSQSLSLIQFLLLTE